jgi:hypothetical protein
MPALTWSSGMIWTFGFSAAKPARDMKLSSANETALRKMFLTLLKPRCGFATKIGHSQSPLGGATTI